MYFKRARQKFQKKKLYTHIDIYQTYIVINKILQLF